MNPSANARVKLGDFLKEARKAAGLSSEEAVLHLGQPSVDYLINIEAGQSTVTLSELYALANIYNIGPEDLMNLLFHLTESDASSNMEELERKLKEAL